MAQRSDRCGLLWWDEEGVSLPIFKKGYAFEGFDVLALPHRQGYTYKV